MCRNKGGLLRELLSMVIFLSISVEGVLEEGVSINHTPKKKKRVAMLICGLFGTPCKKDQKIEDEYQKRAEKEK